jgi:pimeloyl-ACP methyl ester carboxylesterase
LPSEISPLSLKFTSYDGCRLQVYRWGQDGPACIFLHGFGEGSYIWDDFAPTIVPQYRSVAIDLRGHGDSDWGVLRPYDFDSYVRDVVCLIDELGLTHVAIIGHSLGGSVATHAAASRTNEVFALVLVESGPGLRQDGIARMRSDFKQAHQNYAAIEDYVDWLEKRRTLVPREKIRQFARRSLRLRPDGAFELKCDPRIVEEPDRDNADTALWNAIAQVRCPTLVMRGVASSVLTKDIATKVTKAFARGRLHTIDRAGHGLIAENPEAFADAVREFLDRSANACGRGSDHDGS